MDMVCTSVVIIRSTINVLILSKNIDLPSHYTMLCGFSPRRIYMVAYAITSTYDSSLVSTTEISVNWFPLSAIAIWTDRREYIYIYRRVEICVQWGRLSCTVVTVINVLTSFSVEVGTG